MASPEDLLNDLLASVDEDEWEPTDSGFQLATRNYVVKLRRAGALYEFVVENYNGEQIFAASQVKGGYNEISGKIASLAQQVQGKPLVPVSQLDDVIQDLRSRRKSPG